LITVACHDDLTTRTWSPVSAARQRNVWVDGPLTRAVREGAICYLDEVSKRDRTPPWYCTARGSSAAAADRTAGSDAGRCPGFGLVVSYNPAIKAC